MPTMAEALNEDWFHGSIQRAEAESRLASGGELIDGHFLVRESTTLRGRLCVTAWYGRRFAHILIAVTPTGAFSLGSDHNSFFSLMELIGFYTSTGSTITSTSGHRVKLLIACKRTPTLAATSHTRLAEASSSASPLATQQDDAECDIVPQVDDFETATFADENVVSAPMLSAPYNMSNMSKVPLTPPPSQKTDYINTGDRATSFATFHAASADSAFQLMDVDAQGKDVLLGDISDALATYTTLAGLSRPVMDKQQSVDSSCSDSSADSGLGRCAGHEHLMRSGPSSQSQSLTDEMDVDAPRDAPLSFRRRLTTLVTVPSQGARRVWNKVVRLGSNSEESFGGGSGGTAHTKEYCELREARHQASSKRNKSAPASPTHMCAHMHALVEDEEMVTVGPRSKRDFHRATSVPSQMSNVAAGPHSCCVCTHSMELHEERHALQHRHRGHGSASGVPSNVVLNRKAALKELDSMRAADMVTILDRLRG